MNKKLLKILQKRNKARLEEVRTLIEKGELSSDDLEARQKEVDELAKELQEIADQLAEIGDDDDSDDDNDNDDDDDKDKDDDDEGRADDDSDDEGRSDDDKGDNDDGGQRSGLTPEQRDGIMTAIGNGLSTRGHKSAKKKEQEIRSAFAKFVVGQIDESEARSLGIESGNGGVVVPEVIASEVITYAQEENLLRKYGTVVRTEGNVKYPVLVKKAEANVNKKERDKDIEETDIEFDEILLDPAEFDALATVSKKLLNMSGVDVENIVIEELKKAYVRKETNYMFNGDDSDNENEGALAKKAGEFEPTKDVDLKSGQSLYDALVEMKNTPVTEVMKKGRWIINRAALTALEKMKTDDGFPLLRPFTQAEGGIGQMLAGYPVDWTDAADKKGEPDVPVLYFGDFSKFRIQDVIGSMELQKLIEKFSGKNRIGFQIYHLLDGQLVYSPYETAVYRFEIGEDTP